MTPPRPLPSLPLIVALLLACTPGKDSASERCDLPLAAPASCGSGAAVDSGAVDSGATDSGSTDSRSTASDDSSTATGTPSGTTSTGETSTKTTTEIAPVPTGPIVIYAVRHAEKEDEGDDPGLTAEGQARAEALAVTLADAPLSAIYATDLRRTQDTVQPTADAHGLPVEIDLDPEIELAWHILANCADQTVLHAGHSYTLPDFFEALGLDPAPEVDDYGQLWTVRVEAGGAVSVEEARFGD